MISNHLRKIIVDSYNSGHRKKEISQIFNVKLPTVYAIIGIYTKEGKINFNKKGGQRPRKLNSVILQL